MLENTKLESLLNDPSLLAKKAYVAGEWVTAKNGKTSLKKNGHDILAKNVRQFYVKCII